MVAYSFKGRFAQPILDGTKIGTIRDDRKGHGHAKPGQALQLYTGMRTTSCRLVARETCCHVFPVVLAFRQRAVAVSVHGVSKPIVDLNAFAIADGFASFDEMTTFWADAAAGTVTKNWILWQPIEELYRRGILHDDEEEAAEKAAAADAHAARRSRAHDLWLG